MSLIKFLHYTTAIGVEVAHLSYWRKYFFDGLVSSKYMKRHQETREKTQKNDIFHVLDTQKVA